MIDRHSTMRRSRRCISSVWTSLLAMTSFVVACDAWLSNQRPVIKRQRVQTSSSIVPLRQRRQRPLDKNNQLMEYHPDRTMSTLEMGAMSALGAAVSIGVLFTLAMTGEMASRGLSFENLESLTDNIIDAAVPLTANDAVAVTLAEALGGLTGALASFGLASALKWKQASASSVVAEGDFFLARAATLPFLQATGLSTTMALGASVLFATVPYELVKIGSKRSAMMQEENKLMDQLLVEQQAQNKRQVTSVDPATLTSIREELDNISFVDVFGDIVKWLSWDVLYTDLSGHILAMPGLESAAFGVLAALAAQVYVDLLHGFFGFGGERKQQQVRKRSRSDWSAIYFKECLSAAVLFGVYDAAQIPIKAVVSALLSGGVEGCSGSADYNMCIEAFLVDNPPAATPEAQFRALVTSLVSLWNNLGSF